MSALILKLIACIAMAADHTGYLTGIGWLRLVGRISMPIFVYLVASGYRKTSDPFRYAARLIAFGFISERIYDLCFFGRSYALAQNVMFTLALGLLAVMFTDKLRKKFPASLICLIPIGFFMYAAELMKTDYGMYGVMLAVLFYLFDPHTEEARGRRGFFVSMFIISGLLFAARFLLLDYATLLLGKLSPSLLGSLAFSIKHRKAGSWELQQLFAAAAIPFILVYNGSRGIELRNKISSKIYQYSFYAFYPLHLLLLSFLFGKK